MESAKSVCFAMGIFFIGIDLNAASIIRFFNPEVLPSKLKNTPELYTFCIVLI